MREGYNNDGVPLFVKDDCRTVIHPYDIDWWLEVWETEYDATRDSPYETLCKSLTLRDLFDILSVNDDINKKHFTLFVLKALHLGIIETDDITLEGDPVESRPSISEDGSEEIKLADPRRKPYVYIPQKSVQKFLTHQKWFEMRSNEKFFDMDGFGNPNYLAENILGEFKYKRDYRGDVQRWSPIKREAVAHAAVGLGAAVGLLNIRSDSILTVDVGVLMLIERYSTESAEDPTLTRSELSDIYHYPKYDVIPDLIDLADYTNIIYQQDGKEGYHLNLPTDDTGLTYKHVTRETRQSLLTYTNPEEATENQDCDTEDSTEDLDVDLHAVDQFVASHVTVGEENDSEKNNVPVEKFTTAFDEYAILNDADLDDLDFNRSRHMRKGDLRHYLEENFDIERTQARVDGDSTRVFTPVDLDQATTDLVNSVGIMNQETE